jgi:dTDP-4-amino-4,6-dideoxygalactose transaminase
MTGAQFVGDGASQRIFQQGVSLPSSVNLDTQQQEKVISEIFKILGP